MIKRPLCLAALIWAVFLWLLGWAGIPFWGLVPPSLPLNADTGKARVTGLIYKKDVYIQNTNLYLKNANLILNLKKYPLNAIKVTVMNEKLPKYAEVGSRVTVLGRIEEIPLPSNPGQFNERTYYYARKVKWYQKAERIRILQKNKNRILAMQEKVKDKIRAGLITSVPEKEAGILEAMLLGEKENTEQENLFLFQLMGCSHILAVSGLHLSILGGGLYKILRKCHVPVCVGGVVSALAMFFYGGMTGNGAAVVRAAVMFAVAQGAVPVKRTYDFPSAAALAAIVLLAESPAYLYDSSFLLSFGAILGLGWVYPALFPRQKVVKCERKIGKIRKLITEGLSTGIAVWLMLLPLVMRFFFEVPVWGIFVNLLILPTAALTLTSGISAGILGILPVKLPGQAAGVTGVLLLRLYERIGEIVRLSPAALWITGQPPLWKCGIYYIALAAALCIKKRKKRFVPYQAVLALGLILLFTKMPDKRLQITFLDVGQGDCACIQTGNRNCYLVDGGSSSVSKVGKYRLLPFLKATGISEITGVFISHMDDDHVNGILEILEMIQAKETNIRIRKLFLSKCRETEEKRLELERAGRKAGCEIVYIRQGTEITDKETVITCLAPADDRLESNACSQVLRVTFGEFDTLFTGDVEGVGEKNTVERMKEETIDYELLKAAHHGSKNSTGKEFLETVRPFAAVISCGKENRYGHPHRECLERFEERKVKVVQTKEGGAIFVKAGKTSFEMTSFHHSGIMVE